MKCPKCGGETEPNPYKGKPIESAGSFSLRDHWCPGCGVYSDNGKPDRWFTPSGSGFCMTIRALDMRKSNG